MNNQFKNVFNQDYDLEFFSPGRVNLIGEHIDYNGGFVLPMAINFGTYGYVRFRDDRKVCAYSGNFEDIGIIEFDIDNIQYNESDNWVNYVKGVFNEMLKDGHNIKRGFDIYVFGNIPNGSGLSSSASLEVLIGRILIYDNNLNISDVELAIYGQRAENKFIGVNCGIMDQFIIAVGKENHSVLINTNTHDFEYASSDFKEYELVVLNSKKKRGLVDSEYNERREACEYVLAKGQEKFDLDSLCAMNLEQLSTLELTENQVKRATHAITEQQRVIESVKLLNNGNIEEFGKLLNQSHSSLRDLFEVSCDELDFIVDFMQNNGSIGSRMTGAGFGGCAIALMPKNSDDIYDKLIEEYKNKYDLDLEYYLVTSHDKADVIKG